MARKRVAENELNQYNYDVEDDEKEDPGTFTIASQDEIKKREIKTAKRRLPSKEGGEAVSALKGFTGFAQFSGLTRPPIRDTTTTTTSSFFAGLNKKSLPSSSSTSSFLLKEKFEENLRALNEGVSSWIKSHVDTNPLIDLTPIFEDYRSHLGHIEKTYGRKQAGPILASSSKEVPIPSPALKHKPDDSALLKPGASPFSQPVNTSPFKPPPTSTPPQISMTQNPDDDTNANPPEPERVVHTVDDHLDVDHVTRAKLFYKSKSDWIELGVGNLKLIKTDTGNVRVLLRSDSAIGKILLNVNWNEDTPTSRQGKNNLMIVCTPNPPVGGDDGQKSVTYLIRVKTKEEADELFAKLTGKGGK